MRAPMPDPSPALRSKRVTLIGCGNIGSFAASLIAKLPAMERIQLVDQDTYDSSNLVSQAMDASDVGRARSTPWRAVCCAQCGDVEVCPIARRIEDVPLGRLRGDVLVACVDSRRARCTINEFAWRLGIPLIDSGVDAAGLLARAVVYQPGAGQPCMLCGWSPADFDAIEQVYSCSRHASAIPATRSGQSRLHCSGAGRHCL